MPAKAAAELADVTYLDAVGQALMAEMEADDSVFLIGEDVGQFGGAFKVTKGFLDKFGPMRVVDTPIAESGFTGLAAGAALYGLRPVVEYQFADFISCAFDPIINVVARHHYRTGNPMPITFRCRNWAHGAGDQERRRPEPAGARASDQGRGRPGKEPQAEVGGPDRSTFTISNPGPMGTYASAAVINQPNVAIITTEGVARRPVAVGDAIGIHHTCVLGLSHDHRAIDGVAAAQFLAYIRDALQNRDWEAELSDENTTTVSVADLPTLAGKHLG